MQASKQNSNNDENRKDSGARDGEEGDLRLFKEVGHIHSIESSKHARRPDTERGNGHFEFHDHDGIAIGVQNDIYNVFCIAYI